MGLNDTRAIKNDLFKNFTSSKSINIDEGLFCNIIISNSNQYTVNLILNKIVDSILENISDKDKNVYWNFSYCLDQINMFIANLEKEWSNTNNLSIIIWIRENEKFHFSKVWEWTCILYSKWACSELSYMPNKDDKRFNYISSGDLTHWDSVFLSNENIFNYLSKTDITESAELEDAKQTWENLENILKEENLQENLEIITIRYENYTQEADEKETFWEKIRHIWLIVSDNIIIKKAIAYSLILKDFYTKQNRHLKTSIFLIWIGVSFYFLYWIIWWVVEKSMTNQNIARYEIKLSEAENFKELAYQNINNREAFMLNIEKSEELLREIKQENLFIDDVNLITAQINVMKKEFNWIETFSPKSAEKVFEWEMENAIKIIENKGRTYVINKTFVTGPIINWKSSWEYYFQSIWNDEFVDATFDNARQKIVLLTKKSKIVSYDLSWNFKIENIPSSWEEDEKENIATIKTYAWNLYTLSADWSQIYKHKKTYEGYTRWEAYLKEEDREKYKNDKIATIDIDWWIYLLKQNGSLEKFFSKPYWIKWIYLNDLPKNYSIDSSKLPEIIARKDLNYTYFFFDNTIWIFKANSKRYQDVTSLNFIWQVEWELEDIKWIYVSSDNEVWTIFIGYSSWIYKLKFDVTEDWITIL